MAVTATNRPGAAAKAGAPAVSSRAPSVSGDRMRALGEALAAGARRRAASVPARLRLLRTAALLVAAGLAVLFLVSGQALSGNWSDITGSEAPRTVGAAELNLALNDMDAQAANLLLSSGNGGGDRDRVSYDKAGRDYDGSLRTAAHQLRTLAVAAQGDRSAERAVEELTDGFARYQELIGRAREDDARPDGRAAAIGHYRTATDLLQSTLLPRARTLVDGTDAAFEREYRDAASRLTAELVTAVVLGVLLLALLGLLQWYLARRFRRVVNPALLAATVCALAALGLCGALFTGSAERLRVARHDSFDSVVALSRARALAYDANADESRYLLDAGRRGQYESSYFDKSQRLYGIQGSTLARYPDDLAASWRDYRSGHHDAAFTGEFRRELDNLTFPGERAAAERAVDAYLVYQRDDQRIRQLVAAGRLREATDFGISWDPGKSNAHFDAWMAALAQDIGINQAVFTDESRRGRADLDTLLPAAGGALLLAAALTVAGLRPRLAEFR
ncbi:hypothetical protein [Streptomyces orinoci]|uniref:Secreted protein n=1 Tax=Streptomyces orinoci TaxID=67339 RepID=A0ABV3K175_STRON|nr:hypothetical protein [Streptomyces orinoci]